jgi:hypothetical protein
MPEPVERLKHFAQCGDLFLSAPSATNMCNDAEAHFLTPPSTSTDLNTPRD